MFTHRKERFEERIEIPVGPWVLRGVLRVPSDPTGVILFAHGSGSGRRSPRNQFVARRMEEANLAVCLVDLLDEHEETDQARVFDVGQLAWRLVNLIEWLGNHPRTRSLPVGLFGSSTGAAAALIAAAEKPDLVQAIVSRGGRPDLAKSALPRVQAPTLLIVGGEDRLVLEWNRDVLESLCCHKQLVEIPGASHLFPETGALDSVADLARDWFLRYLAAPVVPRNPAPRKYRDRKDAALQLARELKGRVFVDPIVLAIPRGGVAIGAVLARELDADLDVVLARKLRAPSYPELAIGSVAEDGKVFLAPHSSEFVEPDDPYLEEEIQLQRAEIAHRARFLRGDRPPLSVEGRSVILTDDGLATGSTMLAALHFLAGMNVHEIIVAVPVASRDRLAVVRDVCDDFVCPMVPSEFSAIGAFYQDFHQMEDEEVILLLRAQEKHRRRTDSSLR